MDAADAIVKYPAKGGSGKSSKSSAGSKGSKSSKAGARTGKPGRRDARGDARSREDDEPREVRAGTQAGYHAPTRTSHRKGLSKKLVEKEREEAPAREQREREQREYEQRQRELTQRSAPPERRDNAARAVPATRPPGKGLAGHRAPGKSAPDKGAPGKGVPDKGAPGKGTPGKSVSAKGASRPSAPRPAAPRSAPVIRPPQDELPSVPDSGLTVRVSRILNVPASAVFRAINDPDKRGWAPSQLFRIMSVLAPRFIRLAFPDGTLVAIAVARQGNARCMVSLELTKLPVGTDERVVKATWDEALSGLQEQLDTSWD